LTSVVNKLVFSFIGDISKAVTTKAFETASRNREKEGKLLDNLISLADLEKEYLNQEIKLREREVDAIEKLGDALLNSKEDMWAFALTPSEIQYLISKKGTCRLLILAAPPLKQSNLGLHETISRFMHKYYPRKHDGYSVEFYGDFFKRAISSIDIVKLDRILTSRMGGKVLSSPIPIVVLYTVVTNREVFFHVQLIGKVMNSDSMLHWECEPWNWKNDVGEEQLEDAIIQLYKIFAAFLADCYGLVVNPHHDVCFLKPQIQQELLLSESNSLLTTAMRTTCRNLLDHLVNLQTEHCLRGFSEKIKSKVPTSPFSVDSSNEAENIVARIRNFLNSELPNMWSNMRNSASNEIACRLPFSLPIRQISVTWSPKTGKNPGYWTKSGGWSVAGGFVQQDTWVEGREYTYYEIVVSYNIKQAIDEAISNLVSHE